MKKHSTAIIFILLFLLFSSGKMARVQAKLFEGCKYNMNDIYLVSFSGYYLPLIADDLEVNDIVLYCNFFEARYLFSLEGN